LIDVDKSTSHLPAYSQYVMFAGKRLLVRSNSLAILGHATSFFSQQNVEINSPCHVAELKLMLRDRNCGEFDDAPWFRGRGYFALARFTSADSVWFNLRTRRAFGMFSSAMVADDARWSKDILPAVVGILAPAINVVPVHAACLAKGDCGILLAGPSGTGKSTLAITLAQLGYDYLADEWTYLAEGVTGIDAWSIPVPVKLLADAINYFAELANFSFTQSLNGEVAYEVSPEVCFGLPRRNHCRVKYIALLERCNEPGCFISLIDSTTAIDHLLADIEPLTEPLAADYRAQVKLLQKLSDVVCLRVSFNSSPGKVARQIDTALAERLNHPSSHMAHENEIAPGRRMSAR
jgi:hypothetical protein